MKLENLNFLLQIVFGLSLQILKGALAETEYQRDIFKIVAQSPLDLQNEILKTCTEHLYCLCCLEPRKLA